MAADKRAARLGVLALVGVILFSLVGVRLWFLQTVRADELQERTTAAKTRTVPLLPERGRIFDADGRILAGNKRILTVGVDWQLLRKKADREEIFRRLSGWVGVPIEEMQARYDAKIDSPFLPMPVARDVSEEVALALLERVEDFPGVSVLKEWRRVYPYAPHAATWSGTWARSRLIRKTSTSPRTTRSASGSDSSVSSGAWSRCCTASGAGVSTRSTPQSDRCASSKRYRRSTASTFN